MKVSIHVVIYGRVQGVFYRVSTKQKAEQLGLTGWVKNTHDGCVEAVFEGDENIVHEMIRWCHIGPSSSKVNNVIVDKKTLENFDDFTIKY